MFSSTRVWFSPAADVNTKQATHMKRFSQEIIQFSHSIIHFFLPVFFPSTHTCSECAFHEHSRESQ